MTDINCMVAEARMNPDTFNKLLKRSELFIIKCTSAISHHYITKNDEEWSIALLAFKEAVDHYHLEKGSFHKFAELIIRRRLIDYFRTQSKYKSEISVNPNVFDCEFNEEEDNGVLVQEIGAKTLQKNDNSIKLEIDALNEVFSAYCFSFIDLVDCSPKSKKTKTSCAKAISYLLKNPLLIQEIRNKKQLPLKIIEKNAKIPRKILERHRKYIIAAMEILSGEYPHVANYMQYIREEM